MVRRRRNQRHAGYGITQAGNEFVHLAAGELAALAGLRALGDLDLQHLGVHQVMRSDAKPAGCNLFDL